MNVERIAFETEDGVTIVGDWYAVEASPRWVVLLLHMMPATRSSWQPLVPLLTTAKFSTLAIDLRGHGESIRQRGREIPLTHEAFTDEEHQASILDIASAHSWLVGQDVAPNHVIIVGASIGANLALRYLSMHTHVPSAALLSPGLNYRGVETEPAVRTLTSDQAILLVASRDDAESAEAVTRLDQMATSTHELIMFERAGHGTAMFHQEPFLLEHIVHWLEGERDRRQ